MTHSPDSDGNAQAREGLYFATLVLAALSAAMLGAVTFAWWCGWFFAMPLRLRLRHRDEANTSSK